MPAINGQLAQPLQIHGTVYNCTDVLAELKSRGVAALKTFRGPFAIAWRDEAKNQLTLARDPLGHKSLYFSKTSDGLRFSSELRALITPNQKLDPVGVASMVWNGFVMSPATMLAGVEAVLPGEAITFDAAGREIAREMFWCMPPAESNKTTDESELRDELRESIRLAFKSSNQPLALFLSGGIDSSSIVNIARQFDPVKTYCMAMEDAGLDESAAAAEIAKAVGSEHHTIRLTERDFVDRLDDAIKALDQPTFDALNQYHMCRALRDQGIKIALGGIGGDAIFGGDKTLRQLPKLRRLARLSRIIPYRVPLARLFAPKHSQQNWAKLPDVLKTNGDLLSLYQLTYALFRPDFYEQLTAGIPDGLPDRTRDWLNSEIQTHDPVETAAILETRCFVGERLLRDADTVSSSLNFDLRSPLSDHRIIEAINRLPVHQKFMPVGHKPLLRRNGLAGLDPKLFDRPKSGFVLPFDRWIRTNLGDVMEKVMLDPQACAAAGLRPKPVEQLWNHFRQNVPGIYWTRVWAIYVLIRWCQLHAVTV